MWQNRQKTFLTDIRTNLVLVITVFINMTYNRKNTMSYYTRFCYNHRADMENINQHVTFLVEKKLTLTNSVMKPQTITTSNPS